MQHPGPDGELQLQEMAWVDAFGCFGVRCWGFGSLVFSSCTVSQDNWRCNTQVLMVSYNYSKCDGWVILGPGALSLLVLNNPKTVAILVYSLECSANTGPDG